MLRSNFPKTARILKRSEYLAFFKDAKRFKAGLCLIFRRDSETKIARLGITLKVKEGSIMRNKLKRQIRESFRIVRSSLGAFEYNIVIPNLTVCDHRTVKSVRASLDKYWETQIKEHSKNEDKENS